MLRPPASVGLGWGHVPRARLVLGRLSELTLRRASGDRPDIKSYFGFHRCSQTSDIWEVQSLRLGLHAYIARRCSVKLPNKWPVALRVSWVQGRCPGTVQGSLGERA